MYLQVEVKGFDGVCILINVNEIIMVEEHLIMDANKVFMKNGETFRVDNVNYDKIKDAMKRCHLWSSAN